MFLLDAANITMDVNSLPFGHLIVIIMSFLIFMSIIFINGFSIRTEKKEYNIGGIRRLLAKKDEDVLLQQSLKNFADEADHRVSADIYDLVDEMDLRVEKLLVREHCFFTADKFYNIVKRELYKRVRRNNLREKLAEEKCEKYIDQVLKDVRERYDSFQAKVKFAKCDDDFADFDSIKDAVRGELAFFYNGVKAALVSGMREKILMYKKTAPLFNTASARKFSCDSPIEKNMGYILRLTGKEEPV